VAFGNGESHFTFEHGQLHRDPGRGLLKGVGDGGDGAEAVQLYEQAQPPRGIRAVGLRRRADAAVGDDIAAVSGAAVAVLIAWVWLGEVPIPQEAIGGLIVIAGVAVVSQGNRLLARRRTRTQPAES
jgi:hypothetical protein